MAQELEPRKQARQARARVTQEAIVEAAARILEQDRLDDLTTNGIAERAGVSIGSLYQYFPNKEAILVALIRRERALLYSDVMDIAQTCGDAAGKIEALIDVGIKHQFARPRLALQLEYIEQTLDIGPEAQALTARLVSAVSDIAKVLAPDAGPHAARDVVVICQALINAAGLAGETDVPALRRRLRSAVNGYLSDSAKAR
ncbi:TetR/AcrR family transcriptional regulator [Tropicibacter sp. S64]|uniref:TetR/AcrR family transcriptional regulator n=1 Tax=Tropicibacter sp. S64 TaxID=3415122 RepID=UPI003C7A627C